MTSMLVLLLTVSAVQQPRPPARRPAEPVTRSPANLAPAPNGFVLPQDPPPRTPYDTTIAAVVAIGRAVADIKAELDHFRMVAFNDAGGEVIESSAAFRSKCQDLVAAARQGQRTICRSCLSRGAQPAFDRYRAFLPTLAQLGQRCATTLQRLRAGDPNAAAAALRREARGISDFMIAGLRQYEARLTPVREALTGAPPRRGG